MSVAQRGTELKLAPSGYLDRNRPTQPPCSNTTHVAVSRNLPYFRSTLRMNQAIIVLAVTTSFVALTIVGILRSYSPLPVGDDWVSYLGFYADLLEGRYSAWVVQEFGHRPILPRSLIWLDIRYFGGRFILL